MADSCPFFRLFVKGTEAETGVGDVSNCGRDARKLGGPVLYCRRYTEYFFVPLATDSARQLFVFCLCPFSRYCSLGLKLRTVFLSVLVRRPPTD